jgi:membrane-associated protease RseP (regulator of RpoE activity)
MRQLLVFLVGALLVSLPRIGAGEPRVDDHQPRLGMMVIPMPPAQRRHFGAEADRGVLVVFVRPGSPGAAAGVVAGDVVTDVRGLPIDDAEDITAALEAVKPGKPVAVRVVRGKQPLYLQARMPAVDISALMRWLVPWAARVDGRPEPPLHHVFAR